MILIFLVVVESLRVLRLEDENLMVLRKNLVQVMEQKTNEANVKELRRIY